MLGWAAQKVGVKGCAFTCLAAVTQLTAHLPHQSAADGQAGLDKAQEFKPDLILLDIMMPKLNGIEAAANLYFGKSAKDLNLAERSLLLELEFWE